MKFIDHTTITVTGGKGGDGMVGFMRARNYPKLGPNGGNGGKGGDVILIANEQLNTLSHIRYKEHFKAEDGSKGEANNRTGKCGRNLYIPVPVGTVISLKNSQLVGELCTHGDTLTVAKGGKWGYGNLHYTTATRQAPDFATQGEPGEEFTLEIELKLLADVGLAGFPNAGKSTLLSRLTAAKPKIADYPFTTLAPQLGVVDTFYDGVGSFVIADIPGLIEGASQGRGLGHDFLRHLERTKSILFILDGFDKLSEEIVEDYEKLKYELFEFSPDFAQKTFFVAINKKDIFEDLSEVDEAKKIFEEMGLMCFIISAYTGDGLNNLKIELMKSIEETKPKLEVLTDHLPVEAPQPKLQITNHAYLQ